MRRFRLIYSLLALVGLATMTLGACASAAFQGSCDPSAEECSCDTDHPCAAGYDCVKGVCRTSSLDGGGEGPRSDLGVDRGLPDVAPDLPPKKGFGEACADKNECASGICLFAGIGGICSTPCTAGVCPDGYGCLGVAGAIEPGTVNDVCVPKFTQLCSPCQKDSECSLSGNDKCVEVDDATYCGRDCSAISCPKGYACTSVDVGGKTFKQCLPENGACDCDATTSGSSKKCMLKTPFGDCEGFKTCQGLPGWGACEAPQPTDAPDGAFADENCDGIDGDIHGGIFVATNGIDDATCGTSYLTPCLTVNTGISRAKTEKRDDVYIQAGTYKEVVVLEGGIHLFGGYDVNWQRAARTVQGHETKIEGDLDKETDHFVTLRAKVLAKPTTVADLILIGADASGVTTHGARSSIVVYADTAAGLNLERVTIQAGHGADGAPGTVGIDAPTVTAISQMRGKVGGVAREFSSSCNTTTRGAGGAAGVNSCLAGASPAAGRGGAGGAMDTCCSLGLCALCNCNATSGSAGTNAAQWSTGSYGYRGLGGAGANTCGAGGHGHDGRVRNGSGGEAGTGGAWIDGFWYANAGGSGGKGQHGGGGGGGGGSGGCDSGQDSTGAGGGGGGAGGCAALTGGGGGGGGGGSFGVLADASSITLTDCDIQRGNGGRGGAGGIGGRGQSGGFGGAGGVGGTGGTGTGDGGRGGRGGHGGHGGGGGGGAGGVSFGIFSHKSIITQTCTFSGGSAGSGGAGGASAPTAPLAERDGEAGAAGTDAAAPADVGTCADVLSCP